jgi:hypothetical protein
MFSLAKSILNACSVPEEFVRVVRFVRAGRLASGKEEKRREGGNVFGGSCRVCRWDVEDGEESVRPGRVGGMKTGEG